MGAHDAEVLIHICELEQVIDFVKYILDYLYVLPAKLNFIQEQMNMTKGRFDCHVCKK